MGMCNQKLKLIFAKCSDMSVSFIFYYVIKPSLLYNKLYDPIQRMSCALNRRVSADLSLQITKQSFFFPGAANQKLSALLSIGFCKKTSADFVYKSKKAFPTNRLTNDS